MQAQKGRARGIRDSYFEDSFKIRIPDISLQEFFRKIELIPPNSKYITMYYKP